jgi:excisionase family DNA binding protein
MSRRQPANKTRPEAQRASASAADRRTAARLSALLRGEARGRFTVGNDAGESVDLSAPLVDILGTAASMIASGASVAVLAQDEELTSQQAADLLNMSRQYLVRLLERGDIASIKVGTHRRLRAGDVALYRRRRDEKRKAALDELADQAQADGGYDGVAAFGPQRRVSS